MYIVTGDGRLKSRYEFETVNKLTAACIAAVVLIATNKVEYIYFLCLSRSCESGQCDLE